MGRPLLRSDCADLEHYTRQQNEICSRELLDALQANHGQDNEPVHPNPLPPIPNHIIAQAANVAFPKYLSRVEAIQRSTLTEFPTMTVMDIRSQRRTKAVVRARQIAMYLAKTMTEQSLPELGRRFGGRDHTTILHGVRKIEGLIVKDQELAAMVERIKSIIPESAP
jgi:chromosomal replication initiation ATPase DnaA